MVSLPIFFQTCVTGIFWFFLHHVRTIGHAMRTVLGLAAESERKMIPLRTMEPLPKRKAAGLPWGRPKRTLAPQRKLDAKAMEIRGDLDTGISKRSIESITGRHLSMLYSVVDDRSGVAYSATMAHYGAAKAGVINLTRTLAMEWGRYGIRVNCISPGPIETEGVKAVLWPTPALQRRAMHATALKRFGPGREVAWPCVFLASEAAGYINGANLQVDGCLLGRGSEESG
jgi:NAD(P)-dependent dehydrogenase (short-subunit alcohol dehydrogenase family)